MEEQDDFFSPEHEKLLSIATWARYLAWAVFIFYIIRSWVTLLQYQISLLGPQVVSNPFQDVLKFWSLLAEQPYYMIYMLVTMLSLLLRGAIFYLVLKAVSLGLNMIVETDVNYREKPAQGGEQ